MYQQHTDQEQMLGDAKCQHHIHAHQCPQGTTHGCLNDTVKVPGGRISPCNARASVRHVYGGCCCDAAAAAAQPTYTRVRGQTTISQPTSALCPILTCANEWDMQAGTDMQAGRAGSKAESDQKQQGVSNINQPGAAQAELVYHHLLIIISKLGSGKAEPT